MIEEIKLNLNKAMDLSIEKLRYQLSKVRTGRASANILDGIKVDYYGTPTAINQVGQLSTPEARLLQIQPFDKSLIAAIEKAILSANVGLTPSNDGNLIRIPFPTLTEERRKDRVREVKKCGEDAKISIRNLRRDQNDLVKQKVKSKDFSEDISKKYQSDIQTVTDSYIKKVDVVISNKEKELMTI